ncbi:MAG: helix-turn-helix transcriptional regulator, partial [Gammaproteobacteria bacterium]|nr:helix-turn-helix transcriptional regulator [Gammaproteobacteria bacterium]
MTKSKQTPSSSGTREALLLAGERLIAENGIDAVSLRQINTAAGQRNSSAAHYHFGSKEALVRAIFDYRMERVNRNRQSRLETICQQSDKQPQPRQLVETLVCPITEEIVNSEGGSFYIRFLAQAIGHPQTNANKFSENLLADAANIAFKLLQEAVPKIPRLILGQRFGLMWEMIIHALADRERGSELQARSQHIDQDLFVSNLIDT